MSRPDWGALQQEYIAEYTRSGISPVAWCEARGLNYATARRYIKKTPKNAQTEMRKTAQKSAQKKSAQTAQKRNEKSQEKKPVFDAGLNEGDAEEFSFCPDEFGISDQQAKFAMLVAQGKKPTEAYRLAGYEGQGATANSNASRMLRNARVYRAISYFRNQYQKRYTADLDLLVSQLMVPLSRPTPISWHNFAVLTAVIAGARIISTSGVILQNSIRLRHRPPEMVNPSRNMEASALLITPYPIRIARSAAVRERDSFIWLIPHCLMGMRGNYMQGQSSENTVLRSCWRIRLPPGVNCCVCFLLAGHYVQISGYRNWKLNGAE
ncbi:hypothetical protein ECO2947_14460 [Escherichia coli]|nr:hypothetical protein ECO1752_14280 [Escherichia coli]CAK5463740.1 hypothetical protein ECO2947_14460 [Escherichia coli]